MLLSILTPIFLLILLGYIFKTIQFPKIEFWKELDKLNYFILFPSLLLYKLYTADLSTIVSIDFIYTTIIATVIVSILLLLINKFFQFEGKSFTSIYQGAIRFNTYIFLAIVSDLFGDNGLVIAIVLLTFMIPLVNLFSINIFTIYTNNNFTIKVFFRSIFTNPLILATIIGGTLNYLNFQIPNIIIKCFYLLSQPALPLGLLSVGVGLYFSNIKEAKREIFTSSFVKLLLLPILTFIIGTIFRLDQLTLSILVIFTSLPTATSSYVLSQQLGGDSKLMASLISIQTFVSLFTIYLFLKVLSIT